MNDFVKIQALLEDKADCQARLNLLPYDGSPEIKEQNGSRYLYVRKRIAGKLTSTYVDAYSDELYQLLLKNAKDARVLRKRIRQIERELTSLGYKDSELSSRVLQNIDFARANMKSNIYDQAVLEGVGTTFPQTEEILNNGICHGRSGIMLLFNLMYLDTGKTQFKAISDNLFKEIINDASNSEYIFVERDIYFRGVTFDEVIDYIDFGLLNGVSGIVITLMAQRTGNAYPLDRMLFMQ